MRYFRKSSRPNLGYFWVIFLFSPQTRGSSGPRTDEATSKQEERIRNLEYFLHMSFHPTSKKSFPHSIHPSTNQDSVVRQFVMVSRASTHRHTDAEPPERPPQERRTFPNRTTICFWFCLIDHDGAQTIQCPAFVVTLVAAAAASLFVEYSRKQ